MATLDDLARKYNLDVILIFGSQARGEARRGSDMDIALYGRQTFSETEKIQLIYEFCEIFHMDDIDLVDLRSASPLLKKEVLSSYKILFQKDPMLLYQLEMANLHELKELEVLDKIRRERLEEFVA
jgi:predicted nucleotidyltransferase